MKEVAYTRRKQHQASMQYYCALNALQYRKRVAMLEPMLGYTQAQVPQSAPLTAHHAPSLGGCHAERWGQQGQGSGSGVDRHGAERRAR